MSNEHQKEGQLHLSDRSVLLNQFTVDWSHLMIVDTLVPVRNLYRTQ